MIGGHSIRNEDMLFGYAVTGTINPKRIWRNVGAKPGDVLLFTKPLGTGVITTALKKDRASAESLAAAVSAMSTLNAAAAAALHELEENDHSPKADSRRHRRDRFQPSRPRSRNGARRSSSWPRNRSPSKSITHLFHIFQALSKPPAKAIFPVA